MNEQRKHPRYDVEISVRVKEANGYLDVGVTKNMSQGGCLLATLTKVHPEELIFKGLTLKARALSSEHHGGTWLHHIAFQDDSRVETFLAERLVEEKWGSKWSHAH